MATLLWIEGALLISMLVYSTIISYAENEKKAALRLGITGIVFSIMFYLVLFGNLPHSTVIQSVLSLTIAIAAVILFFPFRYPTEPPQKTKARFDERDVMFSRFKLIPGSERFDEYYKTRPEKLESDNNTRKEPGLLSSNAKYFHPILFKAAHANFFTVDALGASINGTVNTDRTTTDTKTITSYIKHWIKHSGGHSVGITLLKDEHIYTHKGRGEHYGQPLSREHKYAIAFTVEMAAENVAAAPAAPIVFESSKQYLNAGNIAVQVAAFIRDLGYAAQAHIDGNYEVICPLVARDAGLGEIGRMGLLMEKTLGPRCRIGVISTDLPLLLDEYIPDTSIINFCNLCKKCADTCPSKAISKTQREGDKGHRRWTIDHEACFHYWSKVGTDCGRCMAVCPYSHPDNLMHNIVRWGIGNSPLFARFALKMDDLLYGRKPKPKPIPKWASYR